MVEIAIGSSTQDKKIHSVIDGALHIHLYLSVLIAAELYWSLPFISMLIAAELY